MPDDLDRLLETLGLSEHAEYLHGRARASLEIFATDTPVAKGTSRFGGAPDLPAGFAWPTHPRGLYRFIGQMNLAEFPGVDGLPSTGLLSFFYAHDEDGEAFSGDPDYVRVYRFDDVHELQHIEPPVAVRLGSVISLRFEAGVDVPPWPQAPARAEEWPIAADLRAAYWELRLRLHPSGKYLFGYPLNTTLAYDPTPGPQWQSLLTLRSDDDLEWCWHDGDWLVTFIERQRLRLGDFSHINADAG
jgi:uncharacterized protein YwqG